MRPKWKPKKVVAYVESYDDISFWRDILSEYESDDLGFEVVLPSKTSLSRGKKSAIMHNLGTNLGTSLIACVDADYDYLLQEYNNFSKSILDNPYVIHTFAYAIENYHCYAPSLHGVCTSATLNDQNLFDFVAYMESYSRIIYDLFVWEIWIHRKDMAAEFPMTAFNNMIAVKKINVQKPEDALEILRKNVNKKMAYLQHTFPEAKGEIQALKTEMRQLGISPENTYMYVQGHSLVDNVALPVLVPVCTTLRKTREREIMSYAVHHLQMENELSSYQHSQCPVEQILKRNNDFKSAPQFHQMKERLNILIDLINQKEAGRSSDTEQD